MEGLGDHHTFVLDYLSLVVLRGSKSRLHLLEVVLYQRRWRCTRFSCSLISIMRIVLL